MPARMAAPTVRTLRTARGHDVTPSRAASGFTLLEVLVAIAIFTIVGALAMGGYLELSDQSTSVEERMTRVRAV